MTWRVVAASVQGTSHRERDQPCQDAHAVRLLPDGTLLAAVADGAGSAPCAAEGAGLAVAAAVAALAAALSTPAEQERDWHEIINAAFVTAREAIMDTAAAASVPPSEYHTTLSCVVATATHLIVGQIGDGAVVATDGTDSLFTAMVPQRGEYANQAYFVTMDGALEQLAVAVDERPVAALALTTDGLLRLVLQLPDCAPHPPFFRPLFAFVAETEDLALAQAELSAFLDSDRVCRRTDDDKTLVLAVRRDLPVFAAERLEPVADGASPADAQP